MPAPWRVGHGAEPAGHMDNKKAGALNPRMHDHDEIALAMTTRYSKRQEKAAKQKEKEKAKPGALFWNVGGEL